MPVINVSQLELRDSNNPVNVIFRFSTNELSIHSFSSRQKNKHDVAYVYRYNHPVVTPIAKEPRVIQLQGQLNLLDTPNNRSKIIQLEELDTSTVLVQLPHRTQEANYLIISSQIDEKMMFENYSLIIDWQLELMSMTPLSLAPIRIPPPPTPVPTPDDSSGVVPPSSGDEVPVEPTIPIVPPGDRS